MMTEQPEMLEIQIQLDLVDDTYNDVDILFNDVLNYINRKGHSVAMASLSKEKFYDGDSGVYSLEHVYNKCKATIKAEKPYVKIRCPKCGRKIVAHEHVYCPKCGQKIDWTDWEEGVK